MASDYETTVHVTPRFEIFYALQALESGLGERLAPWRREMERRLPARARTEIVRVAPAPIMWPLLADALRNEPPDIQFAQVISALSSMDDGSFQRSVLGGVFKSEGAVDGLMSGRKSLKRTIAQEAASQEKLLKLLGLHPFDPENASAYAFDRVISQPSVYRDEVVGALEMFWQIGFSDTWKFLEPQMKAAARAYKSGITRGGLLSILKKHAMPMSTDRIELTASAVRLIPSSFNVSRLWAAYADSHERFTFYIPVLDRSVRTESEGKGDRTPVAREATGPINPSAVFKALGDTTRYAMATTLARSPMTSVELAKLFNVSKPTISHHVALLRDANLLTERQSDNGTVLSLNRRTLERASPAAAQEMYSDEGPDYVVKRSRRSKQ
ncbi:MAG TPA: metalloregulator ArsR/SmtB family transcription factor [Gemmatimonadaceae bacterium]